ncbi:glycosyltransferase family A protein [Candidatus Methylomirabilis sp.]|uniref:glycosyltransferase family 2 protein n=1 Tax=Candidatus Methylomirabilis sp. TaxID=2032687 RepID=UPI002A5C7350|nr:glycosyltransferase family A protein [Candidatus Methylomirabilis sp.]
MGTSPRVTVLIPVYNRERYVATAIESILAQSFIDFELLLIDDASTDGSVEILRTYTTDSRVRLVCNEQNLGIPRTRNRGIDLARGEYIAMLDSDDWAYPRRLEKQVAFLDRHKDFAVVGAWATEMDENGRSLSRVKILPVLPGELQSRLLFSYCHHHSSIMARTAVLREYRYREQYAVCEDVDLFVRLARKYKLGNLPNILLCRRVHASGITREKAQVVKEKHLEIVSAQLAELGVEFTPADLERHFLLLRMDRVQSTPDRTYLEWANAWLLKLQAANQHALRYPERPLAQMVGEIWFVVCWHTMTGMGWSAWKYFWQSPLSKEGWSRMRMYLLLLAFRHLPRDI